MRVRDFYSDDPTFLSTDYTAFANYDLRGEPIVHLNRQRISALSAIAQKFVFYHECAHLWTRDDSSNRELSANCAALRHMRRSGIIGHHNAVELRTFIRGLPARPPLYPDGKTQWEKARACR